jgi:hypothetical protein
MELNIILSFMAVIISFFAVAGALPPVQRWRLRRLLLADFDKKFRKEFQKRGARPEDFDVVWKEFTRHDGIWCRLYIDTLKDIILKTWRRNPSN